MIFILLSCLFFIWATLWVIQTRRFLRRAVRTTGAVITPPKGKFKLVRVRFMTGEEFVEAHVSGVNIAEGAPNDIRLLYDPADPQKSCKVNTFTYLWMGPIISALLGMIMLLLLFVR